MSHGLMMRKHQPKMIRAMDLTHSMIGVLRGWMSWMAVRSPAIWMPSTPWLRSMPRRSTYQYSWQSLNEEWVKFLCSLSEGGDCRQAFLAGNTNVFTVGVESAVLVICPKKFGAVDVTAMALSSLQQPSYAERLFIDLWKIHKEDHCKGTTFFLLCER